MSKTDCISTVSDPSELALSVTSSRSNQVFAHGATCFVFQCQLAVELGIDIVEGEIRASGSSKRYPETKRKFKVLVVFGPPSENDDVESGDCQKLPLL